MYAMEQVEHYGRRRRRMHSPEFKAELVLSCQQMGVSVAAIALEHGINPNLLRRWITEHERLGHHEATYSHAPRRDVAAQFIPLQLARSEAAQGTAVAKEEIVIELEHNGLKATIRWPMAQSEQCATWLRAVMR